MAILSGAFTMLDFAECVKIARKFGIGDEVMKYFAQGRKFRLSVDETEELVRKAAIEKKFIGELRGEKITLYDVEVKNISYIKRNSEELISLRNEFNSVTRKSFLKELGKNPEILKSAGLSDLDILKIQNGRVPIGWQVHHKLPLDDSGTNTFDNLVLIQNEPYHKVITNYQNTMAVNMNVGETKQLKWPIPNNNIYPTTK
jgi:hypothetical protein